MIGLPPIVVVLGPTGSGKSDLALAIAGQLGGEIINCDSIQLYRGLDIGSAKTPERQRLGIPHHLIDILRPEEYFTAGDYALAGRRLIQEITARSRLPVVVGGTGFYLRALLDGLSAVPGRDEALRARLMRRGTGERLHRLLRRLDPSAADRIHPNDTNKLIRALELCILSRKPATRVFEANPIRPLVGFRVCKVGLDPDRDALAERIRQRTAAIFGDGIVAEVRTLLSSGVPPDAKALLSIGYREAVAHVLGRISVEEAMDQTEIATRQYAKRQRTWFRKESNVFWISGFGNSPDVVPKVMDHLHARLGTLGRA